MPPDDPPRFSAGRHRSPAKGTCFMEHASVLSGQRWSDDPKVTHPLLATLARHVNDSSSDEGRQRLVRLVPLVLTGHRSDPALGHRLVRRLALRTVDVARGPRRRTLYVALLAADGACGPGDDPDDRDRRQVVLLLDRPDPDLRAAVALRAGAPRADDLLHDLLADAIALVRGEDAPVAAARAAVPAARRAPVPRRTPTAWTRAAGTGVRAS